MQDKSRDRETLEAILDLLAETIASREVKNNSLFLLTLSNASDIFIT